MSATDSKTTVTIFKGGSKERTLPINELRIPDLWHLACWLGENEGTVPNGKLASELVLETWHIAHDLKRHISEAAT